MTLSLTFPCSSMVEHLTVNQGVAGSSPAGGVSFSKKKKLPFAFSESATRTPERADG